LKDKISLIVNNSNFELLVRLSLGALFIYSSLHKIEYPSAFAKVIYGYALFPQISINILAIMVPFLEFFSGLSLVFGVYPKSGVLIINAMLIFFVFAISINLIRGHEFDCGCLSFGESNTSSSNTLVLIRDVICIVFGTYLLYFSDVRRRFCIRVS
jgi:uncharacterized membrane protein YphA (DoxX/SURF4 family)